MTAPAVAAPAIPLTVLLLIASLLQQLARRESDLTAALLLNEDLRYLVQAARQNVITEQAEHQQYRLEHPRRRPA